MKSKTSLKPRCAQCENPNLKGIHTCSLRLPRRPTRKPKVQRSAFDQWWDSYSNRGVYEGWEGDWELAKAAWDEGYSKAKEEDFG